MKPVEAVQTSPRTTDTPAVILGLMPGIPVLLRVPIDSPHPESLAHKDVRLLFPPPCGEGQLRQRAGWGWSDRVSRCATPALYQLLHSDEVDGHSDCATPTLNPSSQGGEKSVSGPVEETDLA